MSDSGCQSHNRSSTPTTVLAKSQDGAHQCVDSSNEVSLTGRLQTKRTRKVGVTGKYGTVRTPESCNLAITDRGITALWCLPPKAGEKGDVDFMDRFLWIGIDIAQMEITQHARYTCTFCGKASNDANHQHIRD